MGEMVERVARAIYDAPNGIDGDQVADMLIEDSRISSAFPAENREQVLAVCRQAARAAIAALREPTDAMIKAASPERIGPSLQDDCWRAMIDAALAVK